MQHINMFCLHASKDVLIPLASVERRRNILSFNTAHLDFAINCAQSVQ